MPRQRNEQTEHTICSAAWRLFFDKGFAATSYTDLAEVSGVSRSLVQRYVPKKELLVDWCVGEVRRVAVEVSDEAYPRHTDPLVRLYLRGQVNIASYFACEGIGRLMRDVLSSRELTWQTIEEGFRWTAAQTLPERVDLADVQEPDELVVAMGGMYELVYRYLVLGQMPDVAAVTLPSVRSFGVLFGVGEPADGLEAYALAPAELQSLARRTIERITW